MNDKSALLAVPTDNKYDRQSQHSHENMHPPTAMQKVKRLGKGLLHFVPVAAAIILRTFLPVALTLSIAIGLSILNFVFQAYLYYVRKSVRVFPKTMPLSHLVFFVVCLIITSCIPGHTQVFLFIKTFLPTMIQSWMGLTCLFTILIRRPFILDFFREQSQYPLEMSPRFIHIACNVTVIWFFFFITMASFSLIPIFQGKKRWLVIVCDVIVPIIAMGLTLKYTFWYPDKLNNVILVTDPSLTDLVDDIFDYDSMANNNDNNNNNNNSTSNSTSNNNSNSDNNNNGIVVGGNEFAEKDKLLGYQQI